jgi:hypothetical protein
MPRKAIAPEALLDLRRQLGTLPPRSAERRRLIQEAAGFYGRNRPFIACCASGGTLDRLDEQIEARPASYPKLNWNATSN